MSHTPTVRGVQVQCSLFSYIKMCLSIADVVSKEFIMADNWFSTSSFVVMTHFMRGSLVKQTSGHNLTLHFHCAYNMTYVMFEVLPFTEIDCIQIILSSCHCLVHCNVTYSTGNVLHWMGVVAVCMTS